MRQEEPVQGVLVITHLRTVQVVPDLALEAMPTVVRAMRIDAESDTARIRHHLLKAFRPTSPRIGDQLHMRTAIDVEYDGQPLTLFHLARLHDTVVEIIVGVLPLRQYAYDPLRQLVPLVRIEGTLQHKLVAIGLQTPQGGHTRFILRLELIDPNGTRPIHIDMMRPHRRGDLHRHAVRELGGKEITVQRSVAGRQIEHLIPCRRIA